MRFGNEEAGTADILERKVQSSQIGLEHNTTINTHYLCQPSHASEKMYLRECAGTLSPDFMSLHRG